MRLEVGADGYGSGERFPGFHRIAHRIGPDEFAGLFLRVPDQVHLGEHGLPRAVVLEELRRSAAVAINARGEASTGGIVGMRCRLRQRRDGPVAPGAMVFIGMCDGPHQGFASIR